MGSISSEEGRCGSYSFSADVSESESCSRYSGDDHEAGDIAGSSAAGGSSTISSSQRHFWMFDSFGSSSSKVPALEERKERSPVDASEVDMMKERFGKLLLGEDVSGGGRGVSSALAISNAITNLSASIFGELWRLEPLPAQKTSMWRREMEWLLSVSDSIVEFIPSMQELPGGKAVEVMVTRPRSDLYINLPALKKLDAMLIGILDSFNGTEFWYIDRGVLVEEVDNSCCSNGYACQRQEEKWWLPCPKVPPNGLSREARKKLQQSKECLNQILKASMAINNNVLAELEIPDVYFETLPKNGKACLGDIIYGYIAADRFSPNCLLDCLDLSSDVQALEIANRLEAAIHVWKRKHGKKIIRHTKGPKLPWGAKVKGLVGDGHKINLLLHRTEALLQSLKLRFPGLSQTILDMNKIQYVKDVGQSILESYSRVLESLAFNIIARIDDLTYVDDACKRSAVESAPLLGRRGRGPIPIQKRIAPSPFSVQNTPYTSPYGTPIYCRSPLHGSPTKSNASPAESFRVLSGMKDKNYPQWNISKVEKKMSAEVERTWSHPGRLSIRREQADPPERD